MLLSRPFDGSRNVGVAECRISESWRESGRIGRRVDSRGGSSSYRVRSTWIMILYLSWPLALRVMALPGTIFRGHVTTVFHCRIEAHWVGVIRVV